MAAIKRRAALALVVWTPVAAGYVLVGFAVSWWIVVGMLGFFLLVMVPAYVHGRRLRHRFEGDRAARQAFRARAEQRLARWAEWYGIGLAGEMILLVVFLIIMIVLGHQE